MNNIWLISLTLILFSCATSKSQKENNHYSDQSSTPVKSQTNDDLNFCYGLTGIAKTTVLNRNQGMSFEQQQQNRQEKLGKDTSTFLLVNDFTKQVYAKNITNSIESTINFHKQCIALQQPEVEYQPRALSVCPMSAGAIDIANIGKSMGMTKQRTLNLIKNNYAGFSFAFDGGYDQLVNDTFDSKQLIGIEHYKQCMQDAVI